MPSVGGDHRAGVGEPYRCLLAVHRSRTTGVDVCGVRLIGFVVSCGCLPELGVAALVRRGFISRRALS